MSRFCRRIFRRTAARTCSRSAARTVGQSAAGRCRTPQRSSVSCRQSWNILSPSGQLSVLALSAGCGFPSGFHSTSSEPVAGPLRLISNGISRPVSASRTLRTASRRLLISLLVGDLLASVESTRSAPASLLRRAAGAGFERLAVVIDPQHEGADLAGDRLEHVVHALGDDGVVLVAFLLVAGGRGHGVEHDQHQRQTEVALHFGGDLLGDLDDDGGAAGLEQFGVVPQPEERCALDLGVLGVEHCLQAPSNAAAALAGEVQHAAFAQHRVIDERLCGHDRAGQVERGEGLEGARLSGQQPVAGFRDQVLDQPYEVFVCVVVTMPEDPVLGGGVLCRLFRKCSRPQLGVKIEPAWSRAL